MAKTSNHNFKLITHNAVQPHENAWKCDGCDTVVVYDKRVNQHTVNQIMSQRIVCLPPREMFKN